MGEKDVCFWTQMAAGWLEYREPAKALEVIGEMKMMGIKPIKFLLFGFFGRREESSWIEN